jgi:phage host-nuclease inhibitor protein Gam
MNEPTKVYALEPYLDDEDSGTVETAWRCENKPTADWIMRRLAALRAEEASIDAQAAATIKRVEERAAQLKMRIERGIGFFTFHLQSYCEREKAALLGGGKKKSADLLHGRIGWRSVGGKLKVVDKDALLAWLETQPAELGLYRVKLEPEMRAIQDRFRADGVIPPGCEYQPQEDHFYAEPLKLEE